jgi:hypothetical protein
MKLVATSPLAALRIRSSLTAAGFDASVTGASVPRAVEVRCDPHDEGHVLAIARAADPRCSTASRR